MLRKWRKGAAFVLFMALSFGMKTTVLAAAPELIPENKVVINLFDPDDPNLIEIVDVSETARTTSRPSKVWHLEVDGNYSYSAYSNNNIMWTKYVFFDAGNIGLFKITANASNINYRLVVHNGADKKDYYYAIHYKNVVCNTWNFDGWGNPDTFYFGIDTTVSKSAVSVNGVVSLG